MNIEKLRALLQAATPGPWVADYSPAHIQPKLDGIRCIAILDDGVCTLWTRTRKPILGVPHIQREVERVFQGKTITLEPQVRVRNHRFIREANEPEARP